MSKKPLDTKSTLTALLAQDNIDHDTWTRIFQLSSILEKDDLTIFHESITHKIKDAEDHPRDLLVAMAKEGRLETVEYFRAEFLAMHSNEIFMAFLQSHHPNHQLIISIMSDLVPWMDLDSKDSNGFTLLAKLAITGEETAVRLLLENAVDLDAESQDEYGRTILSKLAPLIDSTEDELFKEKLERIFVMILKKRDPQITEDEIEQQKRLSLAKEMLNLTYSKKDAPSTANLASVFLKALPHLRLAEDKRILWREILGKISDHEEFTTSNGTFLAAQESKLKEHQSYFVIERDAKGNVASLYYCDGNNISRVEQQRLEKEIRNLGKKEKGVSLHELELRRDKKSESKSQISSQIEELNMEGKYQYHAMRFAVKDGVTTEQLSASLTDLFAGTEIEELDSKLSAIVRTYAKLDTEGRPIVDMLVPAKQQARGNCVWKAFAILIRAILQEVYEKEVRLVDGKPCGEGYDFYKEFKEALISFYATQIVEMSDDKNKGKFFYEEACQFVREVLEPKLESKTELTQPSEMEFFSKWWRLEIRSLSDNQEDVVLLEALKKSLARLLEHKEIFPEDRDRTLTRVKKSSTGVAEESSFALLRSKDKKVMEFLVHQEFAARDDLDKDPDNLTNIANLMLCLLSTSTTQEEVSEFEALKLRFLEQTKELKQTASPTATALFSPQTIQAK